MKSLLFAFAAIALSGMALGPVYEGYMAGGIDGCDLLAGAGVHVIIP